MDQTLYDAAIIGGGPLGIELAVALKQAGLFQGRRYSRLRLTSRAS